MDRIKELMNVIADEACTEGACDEPDLVEDEYDIEGMIVDSVLSDGGMPTEGERMPTEGERMPTEGERMPTEGEIMEEEKEESGDEYEEREADDNGDVEIVEGEEVDIPKDATALVVEDGVITFL